MSGGGIAGVVIGTLAGVALIALLAFFLWRRKRRNDEDEDDDDDFFALAHRKEGFDSVTPNPLMPRGAGAVGAVAAGSHTHNNSNTTRSYSTNEDGFIMEPTGGHDAMYGEEEYGRQRLLNGSLPDMANRPPLKVVNY